DREILYCFSHVLISSYEYKGRDCALSRLLFFFSSRRRHTRWPRDWSSDVCSSDLRETDRPSGGRQPGAPAAAPTCAAVLREQHLARRDRRIGPREEDRVGGGGRPDGLDGAHALAILAWEPIADLRGLERLGRLGDAVATIAHRVHRDAEGLE